MNKTSKKKPKFTYTGSLVEEPVYFYIVAFMAKIDDEKWAHGNDTYATSDGHLSYSSARYAVASINDLKKESITILSVNRMNEEDFNSWNSITISKDGSTIELHDND